jgi:chitodextrinase
MRFNPLLSLYSSCNFVPHSNKSANDSHGVKATLNKIDVDGASSRAKWHTTNNQITGKDQGKQGRLSLSTTTTKYECPDCGATFDTPGGHRKHYQAFHGKIEDLRVIEQAEI